MEQDRNFNNKNNSIFSKRIRAGKRRTYFFDVRTTRSNDYYLTITESKKRFNDDGYERHKLHLYKEDFNKFLDALQETIEYVKDDLMPEYDFDEYTRQGDFEEEGRSQNYFDAEQNDKPLTEDDLKTTSENNEITPVTLELSQDDFNAKEEEDEPINEDDLKWD